MSKKSETLIRFGEFVKRQQEAGKEDWTKERDEWLQSLNELYKTIESFLSDFRGNGAEVRYKDIDLNEENIGSYKARQMILSIGRTEIILTPVGTMFLGMKGRVDVEGPAGQTRLVLVDRDATGPKTKITIRIGSAQPPIETPEKAPTWTWKLETRPPVVKYLDLTREEFLQALLEVAGA